MANKQKLSNNKKLIYKQTPQVHFRTKWKNKWSNVKYLTLKDYYKERNDFLMTYKNPAERAEIERKTHFEVFFPTKEMLENEQIIEFYSDYKYWEDKEDDEELSKRTGEFLNELSEIIISEKQNNGKYKLEKFGSEQNLNDFIVNYKKKYNDNPFTRFKVKDFVKVNALKFHIPLRF